MRSWDVMVPFNHLLEAEGNHMQHRETENKKQKTSASCSSGVSALPAGFQAFLNRSDFTASGIDVSKKRSVPAHDTPVEVSTPDDAADDEMTRLFEDLEQRRHDMDFHSTAHTEEHFRVSLLGGAWSMARSSRHIYGWRADLKKSSPIYVFCQTFALHVSSSFSEEKYGQRGGELLSKLWMHKLSFLSDHWYKCESDTFVCESLPAYIVPEEWRTEVGHMTGQCAKRRDEIISMLPV
eukprot:1254344-Amphidinium_carterae.1